MNTYTPKHDVTRKTADGRSILVAAAGVTIPMAEARRLGLVKDRQTPGPMETKEVDATTAATALAEEHGIDLATVTGTGEGGRILKADVEKMVKAD